VLTAALGERASAGMEFVWSGKREDYAGTTLGAYSLLNLRASYALAASWQLGARLENLFDRDYELVHGYNTAGRSFYLTVTWQPQLYAAGR